LLSDCLLPIRATLHALLCITILKDKPFAPSCGRSEPDAVDRQRDEVRQPTITAVAKTVHGDDRPAEKRDEQQHSGEHRRQHECQHCRGPYRKAAPVVSGFNRTLRRESKAARALIRLKERTADESESSERSRVVASGQLRQRAPGRARTMSQRTASRWLSAVVARQFDTIVNIHAVQARLVS
jgi:hypothetical protein